MEISSKSQSTHTKKLKMGDETIVEGVNCPKARWIYRVICMLASVDWFTRLAVGLFWPALYSSPWKEASGTELVLLSAPLLIYAVAVVRSFYLPVPTSYRGGGVGDFWSGAFAIMAVFMCFISTRHVVELPIYLFWFLSGASAAILLKWPLKDICVQHVVYTDFLLALVGYLGYQQPVWPAYLLVAALVLVNAFLFSGLLRLGLSEPEPESEPEEDYKRSPVQPQAFLGVV